MATPCPIFLVPVMDKTGTTSSFHDALFAGSYWFNKHKEDVRRHSRLRFVKGVQENHNTQAGEGVDKGCQQPHRGYQTSRNAQYIGDQTRDQQDCYQDHSHKCQKCCIF